LLCVLLLVSGAQFQLMKSDFVKYNEVILLSLILFYYELYNTRAICWLEIEIMERIIEIDTKCFSYRYVCQDGYNRKYP